MLVPRALPRSEPPRLHDAHLPHAAPAPVGVGAYEIRRAHRARCARAATLAAAVLTAVGPLACRSAGGSRTASPAVVPTSDVVGSQAQAPSSPAVRGRPARAWSPNVVEASAWRGQPAVRIEELLLSGRVPGVQVARTADGYAVRVRGATSFVGRADPLYVIDGSPLMPGMLGVIDPADVARIEVLKDAADLAAYGIFAANGVIRITTRRPGSR